MAAELLYFAYGSNLHPLRLAERIASARSLGVAVLEGYGLRFHKRGADGSGKCNALATGVPDACLPGALYALDASDKPALDRIEGAGYGVRQVPVLADGQVLEAFTYLAEPGWTDEDLRPFHWYKALVSAGARFRALPSEHLALIEAVPSVPDADRARAGLCDALLGRIRAYSG